MQISKNDPTEYSICDKCVWEIANPHFTAGHDLYLPDKIARQQEKYEQKIQNLDKKLQSQIKIQGAKRKDLDLKARESKKKHKVKEKQMNEQLQQLKKEIDVIKNQLSHKEKDVEPIRTYIEEQEDDIDKIKVEYEDKKYELKKIENENARYDGEIEKLMEYIRSNFPPEQQANIEEYMNQKRASGVFSFVERFTDC